MNFLKAFQHAMIGYGIKRKHWEDKETITWSEEFDRFVNIYSGQHVNIGGFVLEDFQATDWEAI